ncbi:TlpA disulfide reductase family protein [Cellulophaga sp. L1A9]|uniref:TlpA family protein disulfide reductase n=1 Tax=Cellulophaga sp. L1A9 TaxID=2686362 RepID=UPI00131A6EDB|nr:TlpA disulfide reductase family protein [Cellulophaga sp. L1A9]
MKFTRDKIINFVVLIAAGIILFTPLGFPVKVFVNKLISFAPSEVDKGEQLKLTDYNWKLNSLDHHTLNFERYKDRVIIVNFWATWCPPCVAEMPEFQELYQDYKDKVVFLFVTNDDQQKVAAFMAKKQYTLPVYYPKSTTPDLLQSTAIPATFIINKNGEIVVDKTGSANWNSEKIRKLLDRLILQ